jgi:hypothetical protein
MKDKFRPLMNQLRCFIMFKVALLTILSFMIVSTAQAAQTKVPKPMKTITFMDPSNDTTGAIEVTEMVMTFNKNGVYQIVLTASADKPFFGQFRVNINLFNPDVVDLNNSSFQDVCTNCGVFSTKSNKGNDFNLLVPTTSLTLTGHSKILKLWNAGDRVATATWAGFGNPPGSALFRSSVDNFPQTFLTNEDVIGCDQTTFNHDYTAAGSMMTCEVTTILVSP